MLLYLTPNFYSFKFWVLKLLVCEVYCWWKLEGWLQPSQSELFPPASYTSERFSCCTLPETRAAHPVCTLQGAWYWHCQSPSLPGQGPPCIPALRWTFQDGCSICVMGKFPQHGLIPWGISWPQSELCLFLHKVPVLCSFWLQWSIMHLLNLLLGETRQLWQVAYHIDISGI